MNLPILVEPGSGPLNTQTNNTTIYRNTIVTGLLTHMILSQIIDEPEGEVITTVVGTAAGAVVGVAVGAVVGVVDGTIVGEEDGAADGGRMNNGTDVP